MLEITTKICGLSDEKAENKYCFRSNCNQVLTEEQMAQEMTDYNSSFTVADYVGIFKVMNIVTKKYLAKGYKISLPFCTIRPSVKGTCKQINDAFVPGTGNHEVHFVTSINKDVLTDVTQNLEYKQLKPTDVGNPSIYNLYSINSDGSGTITTSIEKTKGLRILGDNLGFDLADEELGIFFEATDGTKSRITEYMRKGTNVIDFIVPDSLKEGMYNVILFSKPYKTGIASAKARTQLEVKAKARV